MKKSIQKNTTSGRIVSHKEAVRGMKKVGKELAASKEKSMDFLKEIGILAKDGKLSARYR